MTSRKPFELISMETEALKFRSNKMYEAQLFQGEKGPGKLIFLAIWRKAILSHNPLKVD